MNSQALISDLIIRTEKIISSSKKMLIMDMNLLNKRATDNAWSALECIQHLNLYAAFYHPVIQKRIADSKHPSREVFKPGLLGDYFAKSMLPSDKMKKMNTFKNMNPMGSALDLSTLSLFIQEQENLLNLLEAAKNIDLSKTKTGISISSFIKLKLGDTFRVVIYHNERHLLQAERAISFYQKQF